MISQARIHATHTVGTIFIDDFEKIIARLRHKRRDAEVRPPRACDRRRRPARTRGLSRRLDQRPDGNIGLRSA